MLFTTTPLKVMRTVLPTDLKAQIRTATTSLKMAIIKTTLVAVTHLTQMSQQYVT